jgi:hypothetical protein
VAIVRRMVLVLAVTAGMLVLTPTTSWACSCAQQETVAHVARADTIVDGTLVWSSTNGIERTYSLQIDQVFKGKAAAREKVLTPASDAACGLGQLATDERYLFFITGEHLGTMSSGLCSGTAPYDAALASEIEAVTGDPTGPTELAVPETGPVDNDPIEGTSVITVIGTTLVVAAVIGGLVWLRRKA